MSPNVPTHPITLCSTALPHPSPPPEPTLLCPPTRCEICGFTCRQKASLNWHMKKHDADASYRFSCDLCGKKFEKKDNVTAHKSKSHPEAPPPALGAELPRGDEKGDGRRSAAAE